MAHDVGSKAMRSDWPDSVHSAARFDAVLVFLSSEENVDKTSCALHGHFHKRICDKIGEAPVHKLL